MGKIRINELARQLEVPSHEILEMLPKLGVTEKKTHSSSVEDDVAEQIRRVLFGEEGGPAGKPAESNGTGAAIVEAHSQDAAAPRIGGEVADSVPETPAM